MNKDIAMKWVADLRAGPSQTQGLLFDGVGYCCLGRLCVVMGREFHNDDLGGFVILESETVFGTSLPHSVQDDADMRGVDGGVGELIYINGRRFDSLASANDDGASFSNIADWIEQNWEKL